MTLKEIPCPKKNARFFSLKELKVEQTRVNL